MAIAHGVIGDGHIMVDIILIILIIMEMTEDGLRALPTGIAINTSMDTEADGSPMGDGVEVAAAWEAKPRGCIHQGVVLVVTVQPRVQ